jgi:hypothetical protein
MTNILVHVKFLDLIFTWGRSSHAQDIWTLVMQESIEGFTSGPSHVRLYIGEGRFWEFTLPACRYGDVKEIDLHKVDLEVGDHRMADSLSTGQREALLMEAQRLIGTPYDVQELFEHLLQEWGMDLEDDSDPRRFVCSSGIEHLFRVAGIPFRPDDPLVSPQDIRHSPHYERKWIYGDAPLAG